MFFQSLRNIIIGYAAKYHVFFNLGYFKVCLGTRIIINEQIVSHHFLIYEIYSEACIKWVEP